jgi:hypothetical protein
MRPTARLRKNSKALYADASYNPVCGYEEPVRMADENEPLF